MYKSLPCSFHAQHACEANIKRIIRRLFRRCWLLYFQCWGVPRKQIYSWSRWKWSRFFEFTTKKNGHFGQSICWVNEKRCIHHHELLNAEKWSSFSSLKLQCWQGRRCCTLLWFIGNWKNCFECCWRSKAYWWWLACLDWSWNLQHRRRMLCQMRESQCWERTRNLQCN